MIALGIMLWLKPTCITIEVSLDVNSSDGMLPMSTAVTVVLSPVRGGNSPVILTIEFDCPLLGMIPVTKMPKNYKHIKCVILCLKLMLISNCHLGMIWTYVHTIQ